MKKLLVLIFIMLQASCSSTDEQPETIVAQDRMVTVTLMHPDEFTDIEAGNMGVQSRFEQNVADKLAEALADEFEDNNVTIDITFTDIDLAGETRFNTQEIRVIKDLYIPRMAFEYTIKDTSGNVVKEGSDNIKDMGYLDRRLFGMEADDLIGYDKRMLVEYFEKILQ